jgi:hypothetical protein
VKVIQTGTVTFDANDCWHVDRDGSVYILTEPITRRFVQANSDKWALVKMAQALRPGWPIILMDDEGHRVVGTPKP